MMKIDLLKINPGIPGNKRKLHAANKIINDASRNGWGATIVDALDTLYILGLHKDFKEAKDYVAAIDWDIIKDDEPVQLFETVIRYVGGLLSAYDLSHEKVFVRKAVELVDRLLPAFDTPTGIPYQYVNFTS